MNASLFADHRPKSTYMLIFYEINSNPPKYVFYDSLDVLGCVDRIHKLHPNLVFVGQELFVGAEDARRRAAGFNFAMSLYPQLLQKYPPGECDKKWEELNIERQDKSA